MPTPDRESNPNAASRRGITTMLAALVFLAIVCVGGSFWRSPEPSERADPATVTEDRTKPISRDLVPPAEQTSEAKSPSQPAKVTPLDENAPRLVVDRERHHFGIVRLGDHIPVSFTLRNLGRETIKLSEPNLSCKCLLAKLPGMELGPGEEMPLEITLIAEPLGGFTYVAQFPSNDPARRWLKMSFTGEVRATLDVRPRWLSFRKPTPDKPLTLAAVLDHYDKKPFNVTGIKCNNARFVVESCEPDETNSKYTIRVTAKPSDETVRRGRSISATVSIETDVPGTKPVLLGLLMRMK